MRTVDDPALAALRQDPTGATLDLRRPLPPGKVVDAPDGGALMWLSDAAPKAVHVMSARAAFEVTGLWPLLVGTDPGTPNNEHSSREEIYPYLLGSLGSGVPTNPDLLDAETWLADRWPALIKDNEDNDILEPEDRVSHLAPAGTAWPGLAPARPILGEPNAFADRVATHLLDDNWLGHVRLALIPAACSSDALVAARYTPSAISDIGGRVATLRSWERRYGVRVVAVKTDTVYVSVATPATDAARAAHIACEHFVFAPDNVLQESDSFAEYVESLVGVGLWGFWWD